MNMQRNSGFSLIESLVVVSLIGILTGMSMVAIPALRAHQQIATDTESIRAMLLDAKQRTLNQVRPENCLPGLDPEDVGRATCSDTGIALQGGEIIEYANTAAVSAQRYNSGDYVITRSKLSSAIDTGSAASILFVGVPPSAVMYKDGTALTGSNPYTDIKLISSNGTKRTLRVYSFGTLEVQ